MSTTATSITLGIFFALAVANIYRIIALRRRAPDVWQYKILRADISADDERRTRETSNVFASNGMMSWEFVGAIPHVHGGPALLVFKRRP